MVFSVWKIRAFLPRARLLRIVADLPNSIARHLMFQLSTSSRCFCCGSFPSALHRGHVPIVVRRLIVGETRADVRIRIRGIVTRIRVRHTAIRVGVIVTAIDHTAYWVALPAAKLLNICAKLVRILRNAPKQHGNEATEHRASPIYPVPRAAV